MECLLTRIRTERCTHVWRSEFLGHAFVTGHFTCLQCRHYSETKPFGSVLYFWNAQLKSLLGQFIVSLVPPGMGMIASISSPTHSSPYHSVLHSVSCGKLHWINFQGMNTMNRVINFFVVMTVIGRNKITLSRSLKHFSLNTQHTCRS